VKHVLVVAFHFPPESSSSGVLRTSKFVRYLPEFGWKVSVLTVDSRAYAQTDDSLMKDVPTSIDVIRTPYLQLHRLFSIGRWYPSAFAIPDTWSGWYPYAVRAGLRHCAQSPIDAVYSTSPHATAHLIAQSIARRLHIPSIVDFRDPWYEMPPEPGKTWLMSQTSRILESMVVRRARYVIASTPEFCRTMQERYPKIDPARIVCIPNGYDNADFSGLGTPVDNKSDRLVMVHTGNINSLFRDPRSLLDAIGRQIRGGRLAAKEILLRFLGPGDYSQHASLKDCIARNGLQESVQFVDRIQYAECVRIMTEADLLLLLQASPDTVSLVPTKLYEYLRVRRPILALIWRGATSAVLESLGGGWSCDPSSDAQLDACLDQLLKSWRAGQLQAHATQSQGIQRYDRRHLTCELAKRLDCALQSRSPATSAESKP
jgi:glycosyltransferase involved in cell wall biosynthesis